MSSPASLITPAVKFLVLFVLFVYAFVWWRPAHIVLCFCFAFLRLEYLMFSVSLECPFLVVPSHVIQTEKLFKFFALLQNVLLSLQ
jgi:hypothetical protein